jgi:hypothetical protein
MLSRRIAAALLPAMAAVSSLVAGCGTLENDKGEGLDGLVATGVQRVTHAAFHAFTSPGTLVPLGGALLLNIEDDWDHRLSDWAVEHSPVFGSPSHAAVTSDHLRDALVLEELALPLLTAGGDTLGDWVSERLQVYAADLSAIGAVGAATEALKLETHRERPDGSDDLSFPSGHTSLAFGCATLANRNLDSMGALPDIRPALEVTNMVLAAGVGWGRVEGGKHYPSDVLLGAALAHFLTAFIHDAFLNPPQDGQLDFDFFPVDNGGVVELTLRF